MTYDCDAQYGPQRQVYRWHLDIGKTSAVFYSPNNRAKDKVIDEVVGDNDVTSVMARLRTIRSEFPNPNPLEVLVEPSADGRYTYLNDIVSDKMWYEEKLPQMSWETTGRDTTVCGYACLQAKARVYGRDWTVWFAPEIPLAFGPYVLGGLPGLILDGRILPMRLWSYPARTKLSNAPVRNIWSFGKKPTGNRTPTSSGKWVWTAARW